MRSFEFSSHPPTHLQRGVICELIRHRLFAFVLIVTEEQHAQRVLDVKELLAYPSALIVSHR